ncbi:MAG TPA: TadG family pilus assembly protein [Methylophilaceae bacterium]|nr:TadG family pilus assembly protein [Methylophilaceae bacterium]
MSSPSVIKRYRQRGAIGLWGSMTLLLAVMFMALAVDTGRLWMQQRKLQSIADIASMEAARQIGCNINIDTVRTAAQTAANRNGFSGQLSQGPNIVELGSISTVGGVRQFASSSDQEAVRVYVTESVPASLVAGGLFGNQILLDAEAVSAADPSLVAFTAGSFLLNVNAQNSVLMNALLGNLLGTSLNLGVLSYQGLVAADLTLADLLRAHGSVTTIDQLLETDMSLDSLLGLIAAGVDSAGTASGPATSALQQLSSGTSNNATIKLSDILAVSSPNEDAAANLSLNAFSLITAAALFANEQSTVNLSIAGINAAIGITQAPLLAVGPSQGSNCTIARTAQLSVGISASVAGTVTVTLNAIVAPGAAELSQFSDNGSTSNVVIAASPGTATVTGNATLNVLGTPISIGINLPVGTATPQNVVFNVAHPTAENLPDTQSVGSSLDDSLENALQDQNILTIPLVGLLLEPVLELAVSTILAPLLGEIGRAVLDPLLEMLGIRLGGMEITLVDIQLKRAKPLII